jgi:hypothetical protein
VGIVSEADILRLHLTADPRAHLRPVHLVERRWPQPVDEVTTPDPVTVVESADVAELGQLLADTGWTSVPVTRDGGLVAMVSRSDILQAMTTPDSAIPRHLTQEFAAPGQARWSVGVTKGQVAVAGTRHGREARLAEVRASAVPGGTPRGDRRRCAAAASCHGPFPLTGCATTDGPRPHLMGGSGFSCAAARSGWRCYRSQRFCRTTARRFHPSPRPRW